MTQAPRGKSVCQELQVEERWYCRANQWVEGAIHLPQHTKVRGQLAIQCILIDLGAIVEFLHCLTLQQIGIPRGTLLDYVLQHLKRRTLNLCRAAPQTQWMPVAHFLVRDLHIAVGQRIDRLPAASSVGEKGGDGLWLE